MQFTILLGICMALEAGLITFTIIKIGGISKDAEARLDELLEEYKKKIKQVSRVGISCKLK